MSGIEAREREVSALRTNAIAIVGLACRLPGAESPREFWELLRAGRSAVSPTPPSRLAGLDVVPVGLRSGGYLSDVGQFDAAFFGISPHEAAAMDPQQRLALELAWEGLEDAALAPDRVSGPVGVFLGATAGDYAELALAAGAEAVARHAFTGTQRSLIANRISYALGFSGPSLTVDTGQSSSLVAVHLACQSLLSGESTVALAGGVQLNLALSRAMALHRLGVLSPDGRCFAFDARANGFVRGEGGGLVVLKPFEAALADGDPIHCVIRGTAVNNDGGGEALTASDTAAQARMLRAAHTDAGVVASDIGYLELHGTGTPRGDRVEAAALGEVFAGREKPLAVGSAKTNVGHLEAAAGVVGLLKVALAIGHRELPASLNFEHAGPDLDGLGLRVVTEATEWVTVPVVAGVSSFGLGGTNCHVVVEAPPDAVRPPARPRGAPWVLSGGSHAGLRATAGRLAGELQERADEDADIALTLAAGRAELPYRAVVLGSDRATSLREVAQGERGTSVVEGVVDRALRADHPVFVFPGQGGQWDGMAVALLDASPEFAKHLRACQAALAPHVEWRLEDVLRGAPGVPDLTHVQVVQPALWAVMVALARLWQAHGVEPAGVVGHSQGEIAAAHIAGALSLEDAALLVTARSEVLAGVLAGSGGMAAVSAPLAVVEDYLASLDGQISLAAVNGPMSVVVSGVVERLDELVRRCEADGIKATRLLVDYAAHSSRIETAREVLLDRFATITPTRGTIPLYSTVLGDQLATESMDAGYWYNNLRQTVQFGSAIGRLAADGYRTFVEISPHPVLTVHIESCAAAGLDDEADVAALSTLRRGHGDLERFHSALAELWVRGGSVDWQLLLPKGARRVSLPTTAFARSRYWLDAVPAPPVPSLASVSGSDSHTGSDPEESGFAARLRGVGDAERRRLVIAAVRKQASVILGHASAEAIDPGLAFKELGFDSASMVEMRDRVNTITGLHLAATTLFDHPTPAALADHVLVELTGTGTSVGAAHQGVGADDPIVIVGMACRYPGGADSPESLWEIVARGVDALGPFPEDRGWDLERLIDRDGERLGTTYVDQGGFLYDAGRFDPELFGIAPREALAMDPQQRLLLTCSWEALERAGINPQSLAGSSCGVFAGLMSQEYGPPMHLPDSRSAGYGVTGTEASVASGRISYVLGLEGPAVSVDTASSSSLVALHLAAQALRAGECDLALAGGAAVMAQPGIFIEVSRQRGLAPDGRCRAFSAAASGTGWGEGVGVLVLQRLSDARAAGHKVLAVVRGSAINQDGASNGLTAPSGRAQERVIRAALAAAGLKPDDVDAVEAHGSGTTLGDPIEATALLATYGRDRVGTPLQLGSLKSNIGHTQAAGGVGGVIKMVQALDHEMLPKTLWADEPSPHVDWAAGSVELLQAPVPWPVGSRVRRAAVSSFGVSGTNAHVILEEPPPPPPPMTSRPGPYPFLLSGATAAAVTKQAERLSKWVEEDAESDLGAIASTLMRGRAQLSHRAVAIAANHTSLRTHLAALARGEVEPGLVLGDTVAQPGRRAAFVFPGHGGQWDGMAVSLLDESPVFADAFRACAQAFEPLVGWSLEDVLRCAEDAPSSEDAEVILPVLFSVMVALGRLWEAHGVEPAAVVGHSQGEIAAAHLVGGLTLPDAALIVVVRSRALAKLAGVGGMLALALSPEEFATRAAAVGGGVTIATVNGPRAVVAAGDANVLERLAASAEADGVRVRRLPNTIPGHSPYVEAFREEMLDGLRDVQPMPSTIPLYSTVTGKRLATETMDAEHWYRNLRQTVLFEPAVRALAADGIDTVIEVGPHPLLVGQIMETFEASGLDAQKLSATGTLQRNSGGLDRFITALAEAHVAGVAVDWTPLVEVPASPVALPTYAFSDHAYWLVPERRADDPSSLGQLGTSHPLLDAEIAVAEDGRTLYTGLLNVDRTPWLVDHAVLSAPLVPGAALIDLALHVGRRAGCPRVEALTFLAPFAVDRKGAVCLQVTVGAPDPQGRRELSIHGRASGAAQWTRYAAGTVGPATSSPVSVPGPPAGAEDLAGVDIYERLADVGYEYGPAFQGLETLVEAGGTVYASVALPDDQDSTGYVVHPALLDSVFQAAVVRGLGAGLGVPYSVAGVELHAPAGTRARATLVASGSETRIAVDDGSGLASLTIDGLSLRPLDRQQLRDAAGMVAEGLYSVSWAPFTPSARDVRSASLGADERISGLADAAYDSLSALASAISDGAPPPELVFASVPLAHDQYSVAELRELTRWTLSLLQEWLRSTTLAGARLVIVTHGAVAVGSGESPDPVQAALVGLVRSAHSESPDRVSLVDLDGGDVEKAAVAGALEASEPVVAVRDGVLYAPRLGAAAGGRPRVDDQSWRLTVTAPGTPEGVTFAPSDAARRPLEAKEVRVAMRAAGVNFHDVATSMGLVPTSSIGLEGTGVVTEVGDEVSELCAGDEVMGMIPDAFAPSAITDHRYVTRVPSGWTESEAASVPASFLTAYHALVDLARLQPGETLLVHGAAGGVGQAALQIAQHLGVEVYATAHPTTWETLEGLGIDQAHRASSLTVEFRDTFLQATEGRGVDVVLNTLTGELVDASLTLLVGGGRFIELGKTDVRDAAEVKAAHTGVRYEALDLVHGVSPERIEEILAELLEWFDRGVLRPVQTTTRDVGDGVAAFRDLREARQAGKMVFRIPRLLDPDGTVLITGGTNGLGMLLAEHMARTQGVRHLLLSSRGGLQAKGADALVGRLADLGATATIVACDVSDRAQVQGLLDAVPGEHPLTAVVHAAGVSEAATVLSVEPDQFERVLAVKAEGAFHLDELTRGLDLSEFILCSSVAATLGLPEQSCDAAANAVLDALAQQRRAEGLSGMSLGFGCWERPTETVKPASGTGERHDPAGLIALTDAVGLALLDDARAAGEPFLLAALFDRADLRRQAQAGAIVPILGTLVDVAAPRQTAAAGSFAAAVAAVPEADRAGFAEGLVKQHLGAVLGHGAPDRLDGTRTFKDHGIDSLSAVELRTRIARATGLTLPSTLAFDHPTPSAVARYLVDQVEGRARVRQGPAPKRVADEPIAIVGIGCRFPGAVGSRADLWRLVTEGRDVISGFPQDRGWDLEQLFHDDPEHPGTTYSRYGGFLETAGDFDPEHFSISPREAVTLDPQQRVLLECVWEALEDAGVDPLALRGTRTGVFAGVFDAGYSALVDENPDAAGQGLTGATASVVSGRISFALGLEGPAVSIDTACSSSLVAAHLGVQSLRNGECDVVLAGGVTVLGTPRALVHLSRQRGLARDGRCRAFSADASGIGVSEGAGILVLQRLSDAVRDGNNVLAVIRGSAMNQDGASNGLSAPNGPSQERVIRAALADAGLSPADVDVVEAHGTGTPLGDPIEAHALLATYGADRGDAGPLRLGSLKSNIGHTQAAAGVGGVIKMVQALLNQELPATLHADEPSPHIQWGQGQVALLTEKQAWTSEGGHTRRAAVSSFGISGTNAHLVLEEAPPTSSAPARGTPLDAPAVLPFVLSGSSRAALDAQAARLRTFIDEHPDSDATGVARSLLYGRAQLAHRAVIGASTLAELGERLAAVARGQVPPGAARAVVRRTKRASFVFPGQGGQWEQMGVALMDESPVFADAMGVCGRALAQHNDWSVEDVLRGAAGAPSIDRIEVVQPVLFAIMVSLARLWQAHGVEPSSVVGHSQGEIAAAHVIGGLTLEDASAIVAVRSQALARIAGLGGMLALALTPEELAVRADTVGGGVTVAAINGPRALVASGDPEVLERLAVTAEADGISVRRILSTVPGHSPHVEVLREEMLERLADVRPVASRVPLYSTVTGERLATETMDAEHWYRNLRQTVLFEPAARALISAGVDALIEVGPHPVVSAPMQEILETEEGVEDLAVIGSLRRNEGGLARWTTSLAEASVAGVPLDWSPLVGRDGPRAQLPTYAFQHRHFWLEGGSGSRDAASLGMTTSEHSVLRATVPLAGGGTLWTGKLSRSDQAWLEDYVVNGEVVAPEALFLDLALYCGFELGAGMIEELNVARPLVVPDGGPVSLQVVVEAPDADGRRSIAIASSVAGLDGAGEPVTTVHATGVVCGSSVDLEPDIVEWPGVGERLEPAMAEVRLAEVGVALGPAFTGLQRAVRAPEGLFADVVLEPETVRDTALCPLHPALLQTGLQALVLDGSADAAARPVSFVGVQLLSRGAAGLQFRFAASKEGWSVVATDARGAAVVTIDSVTLRAATPDSSSRALDVSGLHAIDWVAARTTLLDSDPEPRIAILGSGLPDVAGDRYTDVHALAAAVAAGTPAPDVALVELDDGMVCEGLPADAHTLAIDALGVLQSWLSAEALGQTRLLVLTREAVAVDASERPNLRSAGLVGLVTVAHTEHPGRIGLVDTEIGMIDQRVLAAAIRNDEPVCAVRGPELRFPRLRRARPDDLGVQPPTHRDGTLLITGGTTGLGALFARRLAARDDVGHFLLVSRRGPAAPGVDELLVELRSRGATAEAVACDVSDREALARLISGISADRPLTGVVHAAGTLANAAFDALDSEGVRRVLRPKLDAAVHLDELTREIGVREFLLFSSAAGVLGGPGQGNYAAANTFLDALAAARRADGHPGLSLVLGLWEHATELAKLVAEQHGDGEVPLDVIPMADDVGLALVDLARTSGAAVMAPVLFDYERLVRSARAGILSPVLTGLVRVPLPRAAGVELASESGGLHGRSVLGPEALLAEVAAALGYESVAAVDREMTFLELGFDSLVTLELRKRLQRLTGLALPANVLYEHETPNALIVHLTALLGGEGEPAAAATSDGGAGSGVPGGELLSQFRRACSMHRVPDGIAMMDAHARLRPRFGLSTARLHEPTVAQLASGPGEPVVYCIPSLVATSGPHEYVRFARAFAGRREVVSVPALGFLPGELLPARLEAMARAQAGAIAAHADGRPVSLVGFSTGGLLASATAAALERSGALPASVILIDSYAIENLTPLAGLVFDRMLAGDGAHPVVDDARLEAMGVYLTLLAQWTPPPAVAPTLLMKAADPVRGLLRSRDWSATWSHHTATVTTPGTHLTVLEDDVDTTADAVEAWVAAHPGGVTVPRPRRFFRLR